MARPTAFRERVRATLRSLRPSRGAHGRRLSPAARRTPLYNLEAARGPEQLARMQRLEAEGVCVFCTPSASRTDEPGAGPFDGRHWYVRENDFPYEGTEAHYLIVSRHHVATFDELPDDAGAELWEIRRRLKDRRPAPAFATVERSGDMRLNGGSVEHLHVHMVALAENPSKTVRFRVSAHGSGDYS
jgi:diadenosine tetraphosphate (Ap4A) HIT family hydrolase